MEGPLSSETLAALTPLGRGFYQRPTEEVARALLAKLVIRELSSGFAVARLVEVEAYLGVSDPACHTFGGRKTSRTEVMWGEAGHLYVYFTYGMHFCANVVTRKAGEPEAVLLRGALAVAGEELMVVNRRGRRGRSLLDGPAKLCQALAIDRSLNGVDLTSRGPFWLADDGVTCPDGRVRRMPRVGVGYAGDAARWPLRLVAALDQSLAE